jgi:hypothetical protein
MAKDTLTSNELNEIRRQVRACLQEYTDGAVPPLPKVTVGDPRAADVMPNASPHESTLKVSIKPDATIQSTVVDVTKAAAYGLERLELLKKRDFPTHKSANAVSTALDALEMIFQDMLKNPMGYLDEDPAEKVAEYEKSLDSEEALLNKATSPAVASKSTQSL